MTIFLWVIVPYVCLAVFVVGHVWRYRYDKFGWTTRSSQLYEDRLLRIGSPLFHFGMLGVVMGHIIGLIVPQVWTNALGLTRTRTTSSRWPAASRQASPRSSGSRSWSTGGAPPGRCSARRRSTTRSCTPCSAASSCWACGTRSRGACCSSVASTTTARGSVWFRSIFLFQPKPELMAQAPLGFQLHALLAFLLFAMWPFTRLVHVFSAPIGYLTRPYLVYRSKDERPGRGSGNRAPQRGWDKPELSKK